MFHLILSVVGAVAFAVGLVVLNRQFSKRQDNSSGEGITETDIQISAADIAIEKGFDYCELMIPLSEAKAREQQIATLQGQLGEAQENLQKLDKQVEKLQSSVEEEEGHHNELKKGKEESGLLAAEIRANSETLDGEYSKLEQQLQNSKAQLTALSGDKKLTNDQQIAIKKINSALEKSHSHLVNLVEIHTVARNRFLNLEAQYSELEKEFTKLVEKELSGD